MGLGGGALAPPCQVATRARQAIVMEIRQALTLFAAGGQIARIRKPWVIRSSFVDHDGPDTMS